MNVNRDESSAHCATYLIPDNLCGKTGINATWMAHGKLGVYAYLPVNAKSRDLPSPNAPCNPAVHHVSFDSMLFDPVVRKLVNESCGVFIQGQKLATHSGTEAECRQSLLTLSRQYRSIVRACLENVQDLITASKDQCDQYKSYIAILYNIELVWHLCEILYVDVVRGDAILPQLMEWISFHFPQCERRASAIFEEYAPQVSMRVDGVDSIIGAEQHADYWNVVIGVLLQGRVDVTRALLQIHSASESTPFKLADRCLRTMPLYNVYGGISVSVFNSQWSQWQSEVRRQVEDGNFASNRKLDFVMKIMAGDETALEEIKSHCETWYQLMVAVLFFTEPAVKSFDLSFHADRSMVRFGVANKLRHLDILIMALLEADLQQVIRELQNTAENGWFAAHLTNLLFLCGRLNILDSNQVNVAQQLKEHVVLDYGTALMGHHSLWQVGVSYLDHCAEQGLARLEVLLCAIPLTTEMKALKIIDIAKKRKFHGVVITTSKVMARQYMRRGKLGNALTWALRSQDVTLTSYLGDQFLDRYLRDGKFEATDLLENLGSCMLVSDRLTFLGKFCEFHQLYRAGELPAAANLLVSLLASKLPPKSFQITLLMDALPLIEAHEIVLSTNDTYILMSCLEELECVVQKGKLGNAKDDVDRHVALEEKLKIIRLSLARNLSRAIVMEGNELTLSQNIGSNGISA